MAVRDALLTDYMLPLLPGSEALFDSLGVPGDEPVCILEFGFRGGSSG